MAVKLLLSNGFSSAFISSEKNLCLCVWISFFCLQPTLTTKKMGFSPNLRHTTLPRLSLPTMKQREPRLRPLFPWWLEEWVCHLFLLAYTKQCSSTCTPTHTHSLGFAETRYRLHGRKCASAAPEILYFCFAVKGFLISFLYLYVFMWINIFMSVALKATLFSSLKWWFKKNFYDSLRTTALPFSQCTWLACYRTV